MSSEAPFPRRMLGETFMGLRNEMGWSKNRAAMELGVSRDKLDSIETGNTKLSFMDIRGLCGTYHAPVELQRELIALADSRQKDGWLEQYGEGIPRYAQKFALMEQRATRIQVYESDFMPGLFQTEAYVRAIHDRDHLLDTQWSQRILESRRARWSELRQRDEPPTIELILNEPVLTRVVGSPQIMKEQVAHLREVNKLPFVTISVLPLSAGAHPSMSGSYALLRSPESAGDQASADDTVADEVANKDVGYLEARDGCRYFSDATSLALYRRDFHETSALSVGLEEFVNHEHMAYVQP